MPRNMLTSTFLWIKAIDFVTLCINHIENYFTLSILSHVSVEDQVILIKINLLVINVIKVPIEYQKVRLQLVSVDCRLWTVPAQANHANVN